MRLGALCARLVAECVNEIELARNAWASIYRRGKCQVTWPTLSQVEPFLKKTTDDLLTERLPKESPVQGSKEETASYLRLFCLLADCGPARLHFLVLPKLTVASASIWWKDAIEKMLEERFPKLLERPSWLDALRSVSTGTRADMLKELKDYSRDKVRQFASAP